MGGTSTDVSLCQAGEPTIGRETTIGQFRIKVPSVDVHTVGAGGGSIAHVPQLTGALRVGPQSAGAEPGPAAYGQGGDEPDGHRRQRGPRPPPADLIGGEMTLDVEAAKAAVQTIADAMGLSPRAGRRRHPADRQREHGGRAARDQRPARPRPARVRARRLRRRRAAARQRGRRADGLLPGDRAAVARAAVRAGRPRRRLPQRVRADADPAHGRGRRRRAARDRWTSSRRARASGWRRRASPPSAQHVDFVADMRYRGQGYEIPVPLDDLQDLEERFNGLHEQLYGFRMPNTASEIVNLRAVGTGDRPQPELPEEEPVRERPAGGHLRPRRPASRHAHPRARRSSPSSTPRPSSSTATRPRSTATSTC